MIINWWKATLVDEIRTNIIGVDNIQGVVQRLKTNSKSIKKFDKNQ